MVVSQNNTYKHVWDDILSKGVTKDANTKYNENMHGPLKDSFQWRTNFRQVEEQVVRLSTSSALRITNSKARYCGPTIGSKWPFTSGP